MDLDPDKAVNDPQSAAMMADIMGRLGQQTGGGGGSPESQGTPNAPSPTGGTQPNATAPAPGQQGFSANNQGSSNDSGPAGSV